VWDCCICDASFFFAAWDGCKSDVKSTTFLLLAGYPQRLHDRLTEYSSGMMGWVRYVPAKTPPVIEECSVFAAVVRR
jgi:hypothetical protein